MTLNPWTFAVVAIAGWMNRQQQQVIEYLRDDGGFWHMLMRRRG